MRAPSACQSVLGNGRNSQSIVHWPGTMLIAWPPVILPTLIVVNGGSKAGSFVPSRSSFATDFRYSMNVEAAKIALTASSMREECASTPVKIVRHAARPLWPVTTRIIVGSPMIAAAGFGRSRASRASRCGTPMQPTSSS